MESLIGNIYDALDDDNALAALPDLIAHEIGARSCTVQLFNSQFELEGSWLNHFDGPMYDFYREHDLHLHDAWTDTNMHVFGLDKTRRHTDYLPLEEFRNSFFYNEFIRHFGDDSAYCLGFISSRQDGGYIAIGLHKGITDEDFTEEQVSKHEALRPHISRMLVLRRNLLLRERMATSALVGIQSIEDAYLVLQPDLRILFANASAEELLGSKSLLHARSGLLMFNSAHQQSRLSKAMRDALFRKADGQTAFMANDDTGQVWRFTLAPRQVDERTMVLVWIDRAKAGKTAAERLQQIYGLTSAEVPILMALSEGRSAQQIADAQFVSVATVRSHVQHIYTKTGVNKASQLATVVASLPKV